MQWYVKAADQGHSQARFNLGIMYYQGVGCEKNYSQALKYFREAAQDGHGQAQYNIGKMLMRGEGLEKEDKVQGQKWLDRAGEQGFGRRGLASSPSKYSTWYIDRNSATETSKPSSRGILSQEEDLQKQKTKGRQEYKKQSS